MGRRRGGGGAKPLSNSDGILRRHIESATKNTNYASVEQLVDHLRSTYPQYARHKLHPFTKRVHQIIQISSRRNDDAMDDSNNDDKRRKIDEKEESWRLVKAKHVRKRNREAGSINNSGGSSSSIASAASTSSSLEADDLSMSEDTGYGEVEPEFDLMKSMLRENLRRKSNELDVKEAVELEVVNNKDFKKNEECKLGDGLNDINKNKNDNSGEDDGNEVYTARLKDFGGMGGLIEGLEIEVLFPLCQPQAMRQLGGKPMAGILLHGPPGCGKTKLAHAIANEAGVPFYRTSATELVSGVSGASEENIRELFSKAYRTAPSIVFIDEIDAIASKRENLQREANRRIVTQLMMCMDESQRPVKHGYVLVIGATNRPDTVDPALRRPGRFDREIVLDVPDELARVEILSVFTCNLNIKGAFDIVKIARSTPGFVGADLAAVANNAINLARTRIIKQRKVELSKELADRKDSDAWFKQPWPHENIEKPSITMADFEEAAKMVQPSSRREGFSTIPNVKWDDLGGVHLLREEFYHYIVRRIKFPQDYEDFGMDLTTGILLYGPPGCGKTLIAKAVANEAGASFIHVKGPEILNKYVGESELAVRTIFSRARTCSPCILFFDEVDALTTKRGKEGGSVVARLLNQLLIELDGGEQRQGVYVIGTTNRPQEMDRALLRPGRFGKLLYVPLPSPDERVMILKALARKKPTDANVDLMAIGKDSACENFSGADLSALMSAARRAALKDKDKLASSDRTSDGIPWTIKDEHFKRALEEISASVGPKQRRYYKRLSKRFKAA